MTEEDQMQEAARQDQAPRETLSPETRAHLAEELAKLDAAEKQVEAEMAPLREQMKPFNERLEAIEGSRDELLDRFGIAERHHCESCNTLLIPGDPVCHCDDAGLFCKDCAPTWADVKKQNEERLADPDELEPEACALALKHIAERVAAGGSLSDPAVVPL